MDLEYEYGGKTYKVTVKEEKNTFKVKINGNEIVSEVLLFNQGFMKFSLGNLIHKCVVSAGVNLRSVFIDGTVYRLSIPGPRSSKKKVAAEKEGDLSSPISGKIVKIMVAKGERVGAKQPLMILEAMKMEHKILAPYAGIVKEVKFSVDDRVDIGTLLFDIERMEIPSEKEPKVKDGIGPKD